MVGQTVADHLELRSISRKRCDLQSQSNSQQVCFILGCQPGLAEHFVFRWDYFIIQVKVYMMDIGSYETLGALGIHNGPFSCASQSVEGMNIGISESRETVVAFSELQILWYLYTAFLV